ncbi:ArnT family glycosyltransferase [Rhodopila sp.]|uniref:ArnT family glycosyltransferase n=1 Tax=Rhodopila sp. TaxID=2480087 RepID=UPI003D0F72BF
MAAATALVLSGIFQAASTTVMLDSAIALCCLLAMLSYAGFAARAGASRGAAGHAMGFGVVAAAALLIKGNAACLALLPPCFILIGRRFDLLRHASFWLPLPIVALLAGPWNLLTYKLVAQGFRYHWGFDYSDIAVRENGAFLAGAFGPIVLALCVMGFLETCLTAGRKRPDTGHTSGVGQDNVIVAAAALLASVCLFQTIVPAAIQDRYLAPILPPLLILASQGFTRVRLMLSRVPRPRWRHAVGLVLLGLVVSSAAPSLWSATVPKQRLGVIQAASEIWRERIATNPSVLIATDATTEGAAVAELALTDPARTSLFAIRGSRLLGGGGYNTSEYKPRYTTPEQVMAAIDEYAIPLVLLRTAAKNQWQHLDQLSAARHLMPGRWELLWQDASSGDPIELYRIRGNDIRPADLDRLMVLSAPQTLAADTNKAPAQPPR